jgi:hypothetical protein
MISFVPPLFEPFEMQNCDPMLSCLQILKPVLPGDVSAKSQNHIIMRCGTAHRKGKEM